MSGRFSALLVVLLVAASAAFYAYFEYASITDSPIGNTQQPPPVDSSSGTATRTPIVVANTSATTSAQTNALAISFDSAPDLAAYVASLRPALDAGDGDAAKWTAKAYDECLVVSSRPDALDRFATYAKTLSEPTRSAALAHSETIARRCKNLVAAEKIRALRIMELNRQALQAGNLEAKANALGDRDLNRPSQEIKDELRRIISSKDAEAIAALAPAMGVARPGEDRTFGPYSGSVSDQIAWNLVACSLGRDCSANAYKLRILCVNINDCFSGSFQDYMRQNYGTPAQFSIAIQKQKEILDLLAKGLISTIVP